MPLDLFLILCVFCSRPAVNISHVYSSKQWGIDLIERAQMFVCPFLHLLIKENFLSNWLRFGEVVTLNCWNCWRHLAPSGFLFVFLFWGFLTALQSKYNILVFKFNNLKWWTFPDRVQFFDFFVRIVSNILLRQ